MTKSSDSGRQYLDLKGKICPIPVVEIINIVEEMVAGEERVFLVDDPLAIKSVPEELDDIGVQNVDIQKWLNGWLIKVIK